MSFTSEQINSEKNMMMLDQRFHKEFGQFNEAAGVPHQYRIKAFPGAVLTNLLRELPENSLVTFRVHKGSWELPDPRLLQIHACIGNFLHMSGQGEIIDKILRDFGDCGGLVPDGGTNLEDLLAVSSPSLLEKAA
ncbi:hypothetical protein N7535_003069 [Penicillium sp. DV-2018c]|nr:hypothetical protein N7461_001241 [Penicillium sp. DV-2018c]KAJ5576143.1 hypothetical protein N7535_003069 [Penicillium sp. DV-2018c]